MSEPASRLHWPRDGVAIRVPPRRFAGQDATCEVIAFAGARAEPARTQPWDRLAAGVPRGARVVLLVAAEDVSFTTADVPALSGLRLREALPNLVEEKTVSEVGSLHVALGQPNEAGGRTLAVVDRAWLAAMQVHVVRAGLRVAAVVPESLAVPLPSDAWSFGAAGDGAQARAWLRTGAQQSMPLPADAASAAAIASALVRQSPRPAQLALFAARDDGVALGTSLAASLSIPAATHAQDPFAAWLAGDGPQGGYGPPLSLFAFDSAANAWSRWSQWRVAAVLVLAMIAVQIAGMQWEWAGLRHEAAALRAQSTALLTSAFPETKVVLDAPLQMTRGLATLRASAGRSDPADFSAMIAASARIFAALPSNALRGADYENRALRLRFAPGNASAPDERDRFVAAAAQEGYALRFEARANAAGESLASLRPSGAPSGGAS